MQGFAQVRARHCAGSAPDAKSTIRSSKKDLCRQAFPNVPRRELHVTPMHVSRPSALGNAHWRFAFIENPTSIDLRIPATHPRGCDGNANEPWKSFVTEVRYRIDTHTAKRWNEESGKRDERKKHCYASECERVSGEKSRPPSTGVSMVRKQSGPTGSTFTGAKSSPCRGTEP